MTLRDPAAVPAPTSANERLVIAALGGGVALSRADLTDRTGLSKSTVAGIVGRLLRHGTLVELSADAEKRQENARRGRLAGLLALAPPAGLVAVLALTHTAIDVAAVDWGGAVVARRRSPIGEARDEKAVISRGLDMLEEVLSEPSQHSPQVSCAVVSFPAAFRRGVGAALWQGQVGVRYPAPELTEFYGWLRSDPVPTVSDRLGVPATADNYANLAALGEVTFGVGRGLDDVIYVRVVDGIGAGLILGRRLHRGAYGLAGEIAHVQVLDDGPWCACGNRGCLAITFVNELREFLQQTHGGPVSVSEIQQLVAAGDRGTLRIMADVGRRVGRVLADACVLLNPQAIIVDGRLGPAADPFLRGVREMIERHTPAAVASTMRLLTGELDDRAELTGAVALARTEGLDTATSARIR